MEPRITGWSSEVRDGHTEKNRQLLRERYQRRMENTDPLVGDYVIMPNGEYHRFAYDWGDGLQTCKGGSFYCFHNGKASMSGSLDRSQPREKIEPTDELKEAMFWIFHEDGSGAHRGVYFYMEVRVWRLLP